MKTALYHKDIYLPERVRRLSETRIALRPTAHAKEAAATDRYGRIDIPSAIAFRGSDIVEVEMTDGKLTKCVVRLPYNDSCDAVYVFLPSGVLKTVWLNRNDDKHATLRAHLYAHA